MGDMTSHRRRRDNQQNSAVGGGSGDGDSSSSSSSSDEEDEDGNGEEEEEEEGSIAAKGDLSHYDYGDVDGDWATDVAMANNEDTMASNDLTVRLDAFRLGRVSIIPILFSIFCD